MQAFTVFYCNYFCDISQSVYGVVIGACWRDCGADDGRRSHEEQCKGV